MPGLNFIFYLLLLGGVYLFRLSYLGWFGPYLVAALIVIPPVLLLLSLPAMLKMKLGLKVPRQFSQGEEGRLTLRFACRSLLPVTRLIVVLELENRYTGELSTKKYTYSGLSDSEGFVPLPTEFCGLIECRLLSYECRDMLELFAVRRRPDCPVSCVVLPRPVKPDAALDIDGALSRAVNLKPKYGGGFSEEHELRQYRPGDTVNSIHWKLSSKTDDIIIREPLVSENERVYLVLVQPGTADQGLETLYWLSLELCRREIAHTIISGRSYDVDNEQQAAQALTGILSQPMCPPCGFDRKLARCVFLVSGREVQVQ